MLWCYTFDINKYVCVCVCVCVCAIKILDAIICRLWYFIRYERKYYHALICDVAVNA